MTGDINLVYCEVNLANEVSRELSLLQKPTENLLTEWRAFELKN